MLNENFKIEIERIKYLISSENLDQAQFECTKLVAENSKLTMPCCLMAYILYLQANFSNSRRYAILARDRMLVEKDWRDILSVSNACLMVGEEEIALEVMQLMHKPSELDASYVQDIAKHYGKMDELDKAVSLFGSVESSLMTFHSWQMFGVALLYLGRINQALDKFNKAIALNPLDCISYNEIATIGVFEGREDRVACLEKIVVNDKLDNLNRAYAYFALFSEYEQQAKSDLAFHSLKKANDCRRIDVDYDAEVERSCFDNILSQFSRIKIPSSLSNNQTNVATPIFIVGMPRTGTTLLEKILNKYSDVHSCGELRTFRLQMQAAAGIHLNSPSQIGLCNKLAEIDYSNLGSEYLRNVLWRINKSKYFTDKHPSNNVFCGMIAAAIPNAKILHITKNPMDACFSNYKKLFSAGTYTYSYSLSELAAYYRNYRYLMDFWESILPDHMLHINYEDLVLDTVNQENRITKFCGMSNDIDEQKSFTTNTLSAVQVRKPIHIDNINAWAKYSEHLMPLREALDHEYVTYMKQIKGAQIL